MLLLVSTMGALNESPSEKEGKSDEPSGKHATNEEALNESPSEKEGKLHPLSVHPVETNSPQ